MILEYYDLKWLGFHEDEKVYKVAEEFVLEASFDDVRISAEKVLSQASPHKTDKDGGYRAFIKSVNKVWGEDV